MLKLEHRRDQERKPAEHQHAEQKHEREHAERRKPVQAELRLAEPPKGGQSAEQQTAASKTLSVASEQRGSTEHAKRECERKPTVNGIRL